MHSERTAFVACKMYLLGCMVIRLQIGAEADAVNQVATTVTGTAVGAKGRAGGDVGALRLPSLGKRHSGE